MRSNFNIKDWGVKIVDNIEDIHVSQYGHERVVFTNEHIKALKEGKYIVKVDGEYTHSIEYKKEEK